MIAETIATINARLTTLLLTDQVEIAGLVLPTYDQQQRASSLIVAETGARFTIDSGRVWQSAHLADGSRVVNTQTFGSFADHIHEVRFVLMGLSKAAGAMNLALRALDGVAYVVVDETNDRTQDVLSRYLGIRGGQDQNYDPALNAFAIRYHLTGITDEDMAALPTPGDVPELPVEVPEPVPGPPGPAGPAGPVGPPGNNVKTNHVHTQVVPAADWVIQHDLGYNPGGIQVFDSAGSQWWPNVTYLDTAHLLLNFGSASFAGKAYLS